MRRLPLLLLGGLGTLCLGLFASCGDGFSESRQNGAECQWGAQCSSGTCLVERLAGAPTGWKDGMCATLCPGGSCAEGENCTNLGDGLYCLPACESDDSCRDGYVCDDRVGACLPHCKTAGCPEGMVCDGEGLCQFDWSGLGDVGQPCEADQQCRSGFCIRSSEEGIFTGWTAGMCTDVCGSKQCPEGSACVILSGEAWCMPSCDAQTGCREGYVCNDDWWACLPDCTLGWLCGEGFLCMADGTCQVDMPKLRPVGAACVADSDCAAGWCLEETDPQLGATGWVGGSCSLPCGAGVGCPQGSCVVLEAAGWCLQPCGAADMTACREGYVCDPYLHVCLPDCSNEGWTCGPQYTCRTDGVCGTPFP